MCKIKNNFNREENKDVCQLLFVQELNIFVSSINLLINVLFFISPNNKTKLVLAQDCF